MTRLEALESGAKIEVYLSNKIDKPYTATIKGYDSKTDLAVLKNRMKKILLLLNLEIQILLK